MIATTERKIQFACSKCGQKFVVSSDKAGISTKCSTCSAPITIPNLRVEPPPLSAVQRNNVVPDAANSTPAIRATPPPPKKMVGSHARNWRKTSIIVCLTISCLFAILLVASVLPTPSINNSAIKNRGVSADTFDLQSLENSKEWARQRMLELESQAQKKNSLTTAEAIREVNDKLIPFVNKKLSWSVPVHQVTSSTVYLYVSSDYFSNPIEFARLELSIGRDIDRKEAMQLERGSKLAINATLVKTRVSSAMKDFYSQRFFIQLFVKDVKSAAYIRK